MIRGFLLDEHLPKWWRRELRRAAPDLIVWRVGDPDAKSNTFQPSKRDCSAAQQSD